MSDPSSSDKFRWYICQEINPLEWSCNSTTFENAMNPFFYGTKPNTKAILISKWYPRLLDPIILHQSLHPKIRMNM